MYNGLADKKETKIMPKKLKSPYGIMQSMVEILDTYYPEHKEKGNGIIQFYFSHEDQYWTCYIKADERHLEFYTGKADSPAVTLRCDFFHWLDLAAGKLNPVWGAVTQKLKFRGKISFFKVLPRNFSINIDDMDDPYTDFEKNAVKNWKQPQSVIIINGSPRSDNGYTEQFAAQLAEGMEEAGASVEKIYLPKLRIKTCIGCWNCWIGENGCVFDGKDDFYDLYEKVNRADMIVYAFPLYVDGMPSILKNYFDRSVRRVYPYICSDTPKMRHPRRIDKKNQTMVLFSICGFGERIQFRALESHFEAIAHNFHVPLIETVFRSGAMFLFNNPFCYRLQIQILESMKKAGSELVMTGKIGRKTKKRIEQEFTDKKEYAKMTNCFWFDKITRKRNGNDY
ncbi:MAG: NAD(P)H-dependent oxidoreductase [Prevotellaceae bacterium]|jgi:putative NADPH-quinone reductase/putative sterol carrier protein|nr:NAD(P)H-dependent oxidoreductase [Prevotellaceae bacterium]